MWVYSFVAPPAFWGPEQYLTHHLQPNGDQRNAEEIIERAYQWENTEWWKKHSLCHASPVNHMLISLLSSGFGNFCFPHQIVKGDSEVKMFWKL